MKNVRDAIEAKIAALPGSDNKKQAILNMSAYAFGAALGLTAVVITMKAAKNWNTED